ncbi:hypothetical protein HPP92_013156 [Vanilla planifolia]|uniref:Uncharacterized protein n=1 Tax=Vanilla planifolia TaxID=51239 RepID=A0A835R300_VANPL|nr:hypothetical protein HPP92_013156 [Vanilla planifolia]
MVRSFATPESPARRGYGRIDQPRPHRESSTGVRKLQLLPPVHFRHRPTSSISISISAARRSSPDKNLLKAKDVAKDVPLVSRFLSHDQSLTLLPDQATGFVAAAQANFMRVIVDSAGAPAAGDSGSCGNEGMHLLCVVRALLKKIRRRVLVGDRVLVGSVDWVDRRGMIEDVFERKTEVADPPVANVDNFLVLFSMVQPNVEPLILTRFLVEAESTGIRSRLPLTSATLLKWRLCTWGYEPLFCSVESKYGMALLKNTLKGKTTVVVGPSGVGKSSLINCLRCKQPVEEMNDLDTDGVKWLGDQRVGEVSKRSGRGKHTTRHVSSSTCWGGYLADTPGFNHPSLLKVTKITLAETFPEIRQRLSISEPARCSFNDCLHLGEPGCLVKGDWERFPYYLQLLDEIKIREEVQLRTFGTKREGDVRYKVGTMGIKQPEPRLELKKHRRVSRKQLNQTMLDQLEEIDDDWD